MHSSSETLRLTVDNTGFLLDRLGQDCHPLQFLRELTHNAIEAIQRTAEKVGDIVWDVDWLSFDLGEHQAFKLSITDNGDGMTGDEMVRYINQLSSSKSIQSYDGNFGVGAKIAAATRNHFGLVYLSWKAGRGSMIHLWRDPNNGQYGLRRIQKPDGTFDHFAELEEDVKPEIIGEHGTKIVLLGNAADADTIMAPKGAPSPSTWISKYLNGRYFRIPQGISIKTRQGWDAPRDNKDVNVLRTVTGQQSYLERHKEASGEVELPGAVARWWILKDEAALSQNSGYVESAGHIAALHKDEIYELQSARSGYAKLQQFGVIFGQRRVVIYVEPNPAGEARLATNTVRTSLLIDNEPLPWADWAARFREEMPDEIAKMMEKLAAESQDTDHSKSIRDRLRSLLDLFKVSRYRPVSTGALRIDEAVPLSGGKASESSQQAERGGTSGGRQTREGLVGGVYSTFLKKNGQPGAEVRPDVFPKVDWVSVSNGTREAGQMEDRAARYLEDQNRLLINSDFRAFTDMIDHWVAKYRKEHGDNPGLREQVRESVHMWFEQALVETVIGLQALKGSPEWTRDCLKTALSDESLTAVVMQRYHPYNAVKRELGTRIASLKVAAGRET